MTDVLLVFAREDEELAEALAEAFDSSGFSIGDANVSDDEVRTCGAAVIVWSDAASQSPGFIAAARRCLGAGKGLVACLPDLPASRFGGLHVFDLSRWRGDPDDARLDRLVAAVNGRVIQARTRAPIIEASEEPVRAAARS